MIKNIKKVQSLLKKDEKRKIYLFLTYMIFLIFFESFGVSLVPIYLNWLLVEGDGVLFHSSILINKEYYLELGCLIIIFVSLGIYSSYHIIKKALYLSHEIGARLSTSLFEKLLFLNDEKDLSKVTNNLTLECDRFASFIITPVFFIFSRAVLCLSLFFFLIIYNYKYALILTLVLVFAFYYIFKSSRKSVNKSGSLISSSSKKRFHELESSFILKRELILFGKNKLAIKRYRGVAYEYAINRAAVEVFSKLPRYIFEALLFLGGIFLSFTLYNSSEVNPLNFLITFGIISYKLMPAVHQAQSFYTVFMGNLSCMDKLLEAQQQPNNLNSKSLPSNLSKKIRTIEKINIRHVKIQRGKKSFIFKNILLQSGRSFSINGQSGSGKTTFLDLISGFISKDNIRYFDAEINSMTINRYEEFMSIMRKNTSYLPQFSRVYGKSISESITLDNNVKKNLDHEFNKYSWAFSIDDGGGDFFLDDKLSGGEQQRLNIARTLYYDRALYIFDESLNGIDRNTRDNVFMDIKKVLKNKILLIVSHDEIDQVKTDEQINL